MDNIYCFDDKGAYIARISRLMALYRRYENEIGPRLVKARQAAQLLLVLLC